MNTALLTAVGSAASPAVLTQLKTLGFRVVGCDIYPREWNQCSMQVDAFFQAVPVYDADAYLQMLTEVVQREQVTHLIPLTDVEVDVLCSQKARFAQLGCTVCTPDEAVTRLCRDKQRMADTLGALGVCKPIPTRDPYGWEPEACDFPLMLKPLHGRSSQGQAVVRSRESFFAALSQRKDYIAQPFLQGDVYTVDVACDRHGNTQALARRELLRTVNGLGTTVEVLPSHPLEQVCAQIAQAAGIVGAVNIEFIGNDDGYWFLEVNPRFSGGVGFSVLAGVDFPKLHILCHNGETIGNRPDVQPCTMTRQVTPIITK